MTVENVKCVCQHCSRVTVVPQYTLSIVTERTVEQERLRFEGDLDKWMKIICAGITGFQPEAYAVMDWACHELVKLRQFRQEIAAAAKRAEPTP